MSYQPGMFTDKELAQVQYADRLREAQQARADRATAQPLPAAVWLSLSVLALLLVAGAAWLVLLG